MYIDLPQHILDDLFHQHEDERDRIRSGIPSAMALKYWSSLSYSRRKELSWKGMNKRKYGNKFKLLKF